MIDSQKNKLDKTLPNDPDSSNTERQKGPFNFFVGALSSFVFAWLCLGLSRTLVEYVLAHSFNYKSPIAQSAASGFKTLVIGTSFLATFTFGFIGLGLTLVFIRSLFDGKNKQAN